MERRALLEGMVAVGALGTGAPGCVSSLPAAVGPPRADRIDDRLRAILAHAALAPSGHNAQPWRVCVLSPHLLRIQSDPARWLPAVDPDNRETLLSIGAFTENLSVAARGSGLEAAVDVVARSAHDELVLVVGLREVAPTSEDLRAARSRKSVRRDLDERPLARADVEALQAHAEGMIYAPRGSGLCARLDELTIEASRLQAFRDEAQAELTAWIRWTDGESLARRDGLSLPALEIGTVQRFFARNFMSKDSLGSTSSRERAVKSARRQVRASGGWLLLGSEDDSVTATIDSGRRFQRMFVEVRRRGIGLHPMSQALEERGYREQVAREAGTAFPQLLLRVGYTTEPGEPVSMRRPVEWFTTTARSEPLVSGA